MFLLTACSLPGGNSSTGSRSLPQAEVVFQVVLPQKLADGVGLYLEILDEVTGIYFNPARYAMSMSSDTVYLYRIPLPIDAEVNYRYIKIADGVEIEVNSYGQQVVGRKLIVDGPQLVQDTGFGWANALYQGAVGRLRGQFIDAESQAPIPDLVVSVAGLQATTASDGTFILENVPVGTHNLVVSSKNGQYTPFQQYATISEQATTPVAMQLSRRKTVKITFVLSTDQSNAEGLPIRIAGNISALGNQFGLLGAGSANTAADLPVLTESGKDKYTITLELPVGAYIKYKYSRGDGFWNSELDESGNFVLRELIVPDKAATYYDSISAFVSSGYSPIVFNVVIPQDTPASDTLSIQFNPYDWMEPLPMVQTASDTWQFTLASPLQMVDTTAFRFCRNGDCIRGSFTPEMNTFSPSATPQTLEVAVESWPAYNSTIEEAATIENGGLALTPNPSLISGVEVPAALPSAWQTGIYAGFSDAKTLGAQWSILSPTWSITGVSSPMLDAIPGEDPSWADTQKMINYAKLTGLEPVLFPQVRSLDAAFWSKYGNGGDAWQQVFYAGYERFILNYADLAQIMGVKALVLGDPAVRLAMDGNDEYWTQLVAAVRVHFAGTIIGAVAVPSVSTAPAWLKDVDLVYVLYSPGVTDRQNAIGEANAQLDSTVYPLYTEFGKPILIGLNIPSNATALAGCKDDSGSCALVDFYGSDSVLNDQAVLYNAASVASFSKDWVVGLITRGYYPFLKATDSSTSIYGKPAYDVLWFWYHYMLNLPA
jgi:hypothetical protein